jgi:MFS family permease
VKLPPVWAYKSPTSVKAKTSAPTPDSFSSCAALTRGGLLRVPHTGSRERGGGLRQGSGAVLMVPNTLALINMIFPSPEQRARAAAFWAMIGAMALAIGPVIGGLLVSLLHWRSIFFSMSLLGADTHVHQAM